jgi:PLP dependent protein
MAGKFGLGPVEHTETAPNRDKAEKKNKKPNLLKRSAFVLRWLHRRIIAGNRVQAKLPIFVPSIKYIGSSKMNLVENLRLIRQRIGAACARVNRNVAEVTLGAVSKGHPPEAVRALAEAGQALFGENKVQEAKAKIPLCPGKLRWHMIGHLQSNKCRDAVQLFDMIESVDSLALAIEINRMAEKAGKTMPILLEVNVAGESSKFGYKPQALLAELVKINALPRIEIHGLMTVPPYSPTPERSRPFFEQLRFLRGECEKILGAPLPQLSMGMSGDFEIAIEEGATLIRVGTALFGPRSYAKTARSEDELDDKEH